MTPIANRTRLFIIEGAVTALVALFGFWLLPDDPSGTRWLTEDERKLAVERIRCDTVGKQAQGSTWEGLKQACRDPRTWLFCLMQNLHISACSFNNFFPTIVEAMFVTRVLETWADADSCYAGVSGPRLLFSLRRLHTSYLAFWVSPLLGQVGVSTSGRATSRPVSASLWSVSPSAAARRTPPHAIPLRSSTPPVPTVWVLSFSDG